MSDDFQAGLQPTARRGGDSAADRFLPSRKVLVVGALGMVGRAAMERFAGRADLQAVGLARRAADFAPDAIWLRADLRNADAARAALAPHRDVTHLVYAALNEQPSLVKGWRSADNMALNTRMLAHTLDALDGVPLAWPWAAR